MFQSTFNPNQINSLKSRSMLNQINFCIFFWLSEVEKKLQKKKKNYVNHTNEKIK
jgi:hypothetical protein